MREAEQLTDEGIKVPSLTLTVGALLDQWLQENLPGTVSPVTDGQGRVLIGGRGSSR